MSDRSTFLITGVLGGLGSSLAYSLLESGERVIGTDNYSPLSAEFVHADHVRSHLEQENGFHFLALDLRHTKLLSELLLEQDRIIVLHCARPTRYNSTPERLNLYEQIDRSFAAAVIRAVGKISSVFVIGHQQGDDNHKIGDGDSLSSLLRFEKQMADLFSESITDSTLHFVNLPLLWGKGQSPFSFPLLQLWQMISRIPSGSLAGIPVNPYASLPATVLHLTQMFREVRGGTIPGIDERPFTLPDDFIHTIQPRTLLVRLGEEISLSGSEISELLPEENIGAHPVPDREFPVKIERTLRELADWAKRLPYFPPVNWPKRQHSGKRNVKARGSEDSQS